MKKINETFFSESHDSFGEIGTLNTTKVKDSVKPVVTKLEKELKRIVDLGFIELIKRPTDWVNEKLCICLDPRPLNKAIKCEHCHLPTTEEIFSQMSGACFFSKLDELLAFGNPLGRYCFKRLPYGIYSTREVFQKGITTITSDVPSSANSQYTKRNEHLNKLFED